MSRRACKELIDEDFRAALAEAERQSYGFNAMMDAIDKLDNAGEFYERAISIERKGMQALGETIKALAALRLEVAEAVD